jgi:hypothetical protein
VSTNAASEPQWLSLIEHPRFREAVGTNAALILATKDRMSPALKWITNDMGRASTLNRLHQLQALTGEVTVGDLQARVRVRHTASDGRILQILRRAETAELVRIEERPGPKTRRRIVLLPGIYDLFRDRARAEIEAAGVLFPDILPALARTADDGFLAAFIGGLDRFDRNPALRGPANPAIRFFLTHDGGLVMLYDLLVRQAPERAPLLEAAPFSRSRLAARFAISRTHVRRVFAEAEEAGLVSFPSQNRIVFAPGLSKEAERHFALTFHVIASVAAAALTA